MSKNQLALQAAPTAGTAPGTLLEAGEAYEPSSRAARDLAAAEAELDRYIASDQHVADVEWLCHQLDTGAEAPQG